jgi:hypothetical protein
MFAPGGQGRRQEWTSALVSLQIDEKTKVRVSQTLKRNLQKQQAAWGGATSIKKHVSGTASSVAFTPLQVSFSLTLKTKLCSRTGSAGPKLCRFVSEALFKYFTQMICRADGLSNVGSITQTKAICFEPIVIANNSGA